MEPLVELLRFVEGQLSPLGLPSDMHGVSAVVLQGPRGELTPVAVAIEAHRLRVVEPAWVEGPALEVDEAALAQVLLGRRPDRAPFRCSQPNHPLLSALAQLGEGGLAPHAVRTLDV